MEKTKFNPKLLYKLLKEKKYDEIYDTFGSLTYVFFADIKHKKQDVARLIQNNDYKTLFEKYGLNEPFISKKYNKHFNKLLSDGNYNEIISIYGYDFYENHKYKIIKSGLSRETGSKVKANSVVFKEMVKDSMRCVLKNSYIFIFALNILIAQLRTSIYLESVNEYKNVLEIYNSKIDEYAEYINSLDIDNDLDIVMKVMNDMWNEIDGYGVAENESVGLYRIAFAENNNAGVCRNLADDFSARLNRINPEYKADTLVVEANFDYYTSESTANIDFRFADGYVHEGSESSNENYLGNHMVSTFKPLDKNYTLVVDPTNPSIGIIMNGKIYMFSTLEGKGLDFKPLGQLFFSLENYYGNTMYDFYKSIFLYTSNEKVEELNKLWGMDAQNKSLEKIIKY